MNNRQIWNKKLVIKEILYLKKANFPLSATDMINSKCRLYNAAKNYFKTWQNALETAGINYQSTRRNNKWSKKSIIKSIVALKDNGESLYAGDMRRDHSKLFSSAGSKYYFGSWIKALKAAGINYLPFLRKRRAQIRKMYSRKRRSQFNDPALEKAFQLYCHEKKTYSGVANNTLERYQTDAFRLQRYYNHIGIKLCFKTITLKHLKLYFLWIKNTLEISKCSIAANHSFLKNFLNYCKACNFIDENPTIKIFRPHFINNILVDRLSEEELLQIVEYLKERARDGSFLSSRNLLIFGIFALCGLRLEEATRLRTKDINIQEKFLFVRESKYKKERIVPISDTFVVWLKDYLSKRKESRISYLLLREYNDDRIDSPGIYSAIAKLSRRVKLSRRIYPHLLRHTFASLLFEKGANLKSIQDMLGHSSAFTTLKYIKVSTEYLRKEIEKHPLMNYEDGKNTEG